MHKVLKYIESIGSFAMRKIFFIQSGDRITDGIFNICVSVKNIVFLGFYKTQILKHAFQFSFLSLFVIFLTALCTGAVLTLQTYSGLGFFASSDSIARVVVPSIIRELGPVLTGLMIAGRISSSIAAEISTMKTSDQINALVTLSINPVKYLALPRIFVGIMLMPLLLTVADVISIFGSFLIAVGKFDIVSSIYINSLREYFILNDFIVGIVKSLFFGAIITTVGCLKGMQSQGGSSGVGIATTEAVVTASIMILLVNYLLTLTFF